MLRPGRSDPIIYYCNMWSYNIIHQIPLSTSLLPEPQKYSLKSLKRFWQWTPHDVPFFWAQRRRGEWSRSPRAATSSWTPWTSGPASGTFGSSPLRAPTEGPCSRGSRAKFALAKMCQIWKTAVSGSPIKFYACKQFTQEISFSCTHLISNFFSRNLHSLF